MSFLLGLYTRPHWMMSHSFQAIVTLCVVQAIRRRRAPLVLSMLVLGLSVGNVFAQDAAPEKAAEKQAEADNYMVAADLLPQSTAGYLRIPDVPEFRTSWRKLHIGQLIDDPAMKDFLDAQRARVENYMDSTDHKIGIRPKELVDVVTGEITLAWIPFKNDKLRPYSICIIADVRGKEAESRAVLDQIDQDLKTAGATRKDVKYRDQEVRVYSTKPKPGQLKVNQVAVTHDGTRVIASDRDTVVQDLLDAIGGSPKGEPLSRVADFKTVMDKSSKSLAVTADDNGKVGFEWFGRPFEMGRILREVFEVDRGNQVDILKLLEGQGFDAVQSLGGVAALAGDRFDVLHRGHVLANRPFKNAAVMLEFLNLPLRPIPDWIHNEVGSFNRLNWNVEKGFWASEGLINEALGDEIFRDMIEGIRDDEEGPQIDLEKNFFPNLGDTIILIADSTVPAEVDSERMLVAVELKNAAAIKNVIRKAMEVEPDATKIDALPDVDIWRVQRGESDDDLDAELAELGFDDEEGMDDGQKPLLDHWAIAVVDQGPGSPAAYLMFSSHPEFLIEAAKRIKSGAKDGLESLQPTKNVAAAMKDLGAKNVGIDRVSLLKMAIRAKYELLRKGKLKDSDSVLSTLLRRATDGEDGGQPDPLNATKLPPIGQIEKYLTDGGAFVEETKEGWSFTGFFLR
ncbi:MAG: membrane or secreted protein [Pirellulaceae bacterium]